MLQNSEVKPQCGMSYQWNFITRVMGFLPGNFQLATSFHLRLRVRHGTDRQTDRRRPSTLNAQLSGGGGIILADGWLLLGAADTDVRQITAYT